MAANIVIVMCEGPHDVAFLTKILKTHGYSNRSDTTVLSKFPTPINDYLISEIKKSNIEDIKFDQIRNSLIPSATLVKGEVYLFFYALHGESKKPQRQKILIDLLGFIPKPGEITNMPHGQQITLIYFFDSDNQGVETRLSQINNEIEEITGVKPINEHSTFSHTNGLNIGAYIFTGTDNNTGKLEDIVVPIMSEGNEKIFSDANRYILENHNVDRVQGNNFNREKSVIGIAGQLQKSGSTNTVIISQTDYITNEKIAQNQKCQEIITFFNSIDE